MNIHKREGSGHYESGRWCLTTTLGDGYGRNVVAHLVDMGGCVHWTKADP